MIEEHLSVIKSYLAAIEDGDRQAMLAQCGPEMEQIEWPNFLKRHGDRRTRAKLAEDFEHGRSILSSQSYQILHSAAQADTIIVELTWRGVLALEVGTLKAGDTLVAHCAMGFTLAGGKILSQRNYDCFEGF